MDRRTFLMGMGLSVFSIIGCGDSGDGSVLQDLQSRAKSIDLDSFEQLGLMVTRNPNYVRQSVLQ